MIRALSLSCVAVVLGGAAHAQAVDISPPMSAGAAAAQASAQAADPGRTRDADKSGLSSRGGPNPAATNRTYSATIGTRIYSTVGQPIGTRIGPRG